VFDVVQRAVDADVGGRTSREVQVGSTPATACGAACHLYEERVADIDIDVGGRTPDLRVGFTLAPDEIRFTGPAEVF